jgi:hypothetical protein
MGLFDKIKDQASGISSKLDAGINQAQSKIGEVQDKRKRDSLLQQIGELALLEHRNQSAPDGLDKVNELFAQLDAMDTPGPQS